jgi:glucoamylase
LVIEVITDPHQACLLLDGRLEGDSELLRRLHLYVLLAPHMEVAGWGNNGTVARIAGRQFLTANKQGTWLALAATAPFARRSCGYVGTTDGWQDLANNFKMDHAFAAAPDGNIALTGEIDLSRSYRFTLGLGFGNTLHRAVTTLIQSLATGVLFPGSLVIERGRLLSPRLALGDFHQSLYSPGCTTIDSRVSCDQFLAGVELLCPRPRTT